MSVRDKNNSGWKGDAARAETKRGRWANRPIPAGTCCEDCGESLAVDRHHKDDDPGNNVPENIAFLCRSCHMRADGRLELLAAFSRAREKHPPKPCIECSRLYRPLRRGLCHACNERKRRRLARAAA